MKCDVLIPVYNSADWVERCLVALVQVDRSASLGRVLLLNDGSSARTRDKLLQWQARLPDRLVLIENEQNLGFVRSVNRGFEWFLNSSEADVIVLLNSDCLLADQGLDRLMAHFLVQPALGAICPLSNNAANLSIPIPSGLNFRSFASFLYREFEGESRRACTITGNCLALSRECLRAVGPFDVGYGTGYGEESDFHYRAVALGFQCRVALDVFVYHQAGVSFGKSAAADTQRAANHRRFMEYWGEIYRADLDEYQKSDPVAEVQEVVTAHAVEFASGPFTHVFLLPGLNSHFGGVRIVVEICHALVMAGFNPQIYLTETAISYGDFLLFTPLGLSYSQHLAVLGGVHQEQLEKSLRYEPYDRCAANPGHVRLHPNLHGVVARCIIGTSWETYFAAFVYSRRQAIPFVAFCQGWELNFDGLNSFHLCDEAMTLPDHVVTVSGWLARRVERMFRKPTTVCLNGINTDVFHPPRERTDRPFSVFVYLRGGWVGSIKGDRVALDFVALLRRARPDARIVLLLPEHMLNDLFIIRYGAVVIPAPSNHGRIADVLRSCDVFVEASPQEGFGLLPLEAMACGCVPVVVENGGCADYLRHGENGLVASNGSAEALLELVCGLAEDAPTLDRLRARGIEIGARLSREHMVASHLAGPLVTEAAMSVPSPLVRQLIDAFAELRDEGEVLQVRQCGIAEEAKNFFLASAVADDFGFRRQAARSSNAKPARPMSAVHESVPPARVL